MLGLILRDAKHGNGQDPEGEVKTAWKRRGTPQAQGPTEERRSMANRETWGAIWEGEHCRKTSKEACDQTQVSLAISHKFFDFDPFLSAIYAAPLLRYDTVISNLQWETGCRRLLPLVQVLIL